jgi:glycosyltransferase involved in cell wall biosynthesis
MGESVRDVIIMSTWSWDVFNVPERVALALASRGARVLYCEMPASHFRHAIKPLDEVAKNVYRFVPEYLGGKLRFVPGVGDLQWKMVAKQILGNAKALNLKDPLFLYSHIDRMTPLCDEMKAAGIPLVHICMDYPEMYQYELIAVSDQTLVIPRSVFCKLRSKFGEKIQWIPQSIHLPAENSSSSESPPESAAPGSIPRPRLGYLGPIFARVNLPLLREVLRSHPDWQFICFGGAEDLRLPNAHNSKWLSPEAIPSFTAALDVGVMPYDCFEEKNLHCVPLKLFDYLLAGLPVVATPVISLWEFSDLIYLGDTSEDFSRALREALEEPANSPKRKLRQDVARAHSTEELGRRLEEILPRLA